MEYSQLTMFWQFQVNREGIQPDIHVHPFSPRLRSHPHCDIFDGFKTSSSSTPNFLWPSPSVFLKVWFSSPSNLTILSVWNLYRHAAWGRRRQWHPTPVLLPGKSHGWRSLEGCSPWGRWGSNMTEWLHFHFSLSCIGEGNGNPFQCSCLENLRDRGAWWAAIYGVTQSQTRLKWLSNSNMF